MQCIIMENTLIKLTHHDETKKRAHDSQIVRAKENLRLMFIWRINALEWVRCLFSYFCLGVASDKKIITFLPARCLALISVNLFEENYQTIPSSFQDI